MMTCREATRLMSEGRERPLTLKEKTALLFHTGMCGACRRFNRQIDTMSRLAHQYACGPDTDTDRDRPDSSNPRD